MKALGETQAVNCKVENRLEGAPNLTRWYRMLCSTVNSNLRPAAQAWLQTEDDGNVPLPYPDTWFFSVARADGTESVVTRDKTVRWIHDSPDWLDYPDSDLFLPVEVSPFQVGRLGGRAS